MQRAADLAAVVGGASPERAEDAPVALVRPRLGWREGAGCRGCPPAVFFPTVEADEERPKEVCAQCPVRIDCLVDAIVEHEVEGVRGGLNERERRSLTRKVRRRARQCGLGTLATLAMYLGEPTANAGVTADAGPAMTGRPNVC